MESEYDKELVKNINDEMVNGAVIIHDDTQFYFDEIEKRYPVGYNGIDWTKNGYIYYANIDTNNVKSRAEKLTIFLTLIIRNFPELNNERIIVLGDGLIKLAYEMNFKIFINHFDKFFDLPQHTYVLFLEHNKCINLTFENEVFFG